MMFAFRNLSPKRLLIGAGFCFLFMLARENADLYRDKEMIYKGEIAAAMDTTKVKLNDIQKEELKAMLDFKERSYTGKQAEADGKSNSRKLQAAMKNCINSERIFTLIHLVQYLFFWCMGCLIVHVPWHGIFKNGNFNGPSAG